MLHFWTKIMVSVRGCFNVNPECIAASYQMFNKMASYSAPAAWYQSKLIQQDKLCICIHPNFKLIFAGFIFFPKTFKMSKTGLKIGDFCTFLISGYSKSLFILNYQVKTEKSSCIFPQDDWFFFCT